MNIKKFIAPTTRQALKDIRNELGDEAVILSNRAIDEGVEIIAVANQDMAQLAMPANTAHVAEKQLQTSSRVEMEEEDDEVVVYEPKPVSRAIARAPVQTQTQPQSRLQAQAVNKQDINKITHFSHQDFEPQGFDRQSFAPQNFDHQNIESRVEHRVDLDAIDDEPELHVRSARPAVQPAPVQTAPVQAINLQPSVAMPSAAAMSAPAMMMDNNILLEIKSMHQQLQQQLAALSLAGAQPRQNPQHSHLLRRLLNAGFSSALSRQMVEKLPADREAEAWVKQVLKHNMRSQDEADGIVNQGGVYALIGPTGVGKTTTTAKLAARAVVRYGADKVALLTTDSYRIGAYEQLKIYGKILGVSVHAVKDVDDLRLTLSALKQKHLILIDTVGMGQRDERVLDQRAMFEAAKVRCLLLLNATSSGETLEDVVQMYQKSQQAMNNVIGCILTKLDEAVNPGAVLDVVVRNRLVMHFMANGQRVPEDLHAINKDYLLHQAFKVVNEKTPFTLQDLDFDAMMAEDMSVAAAAVKRSALSSLGGV